MAVSKSIAFPLKLFLFFLFGVISNAAVAQAKLDGKIIDAQGAPLPYSNVLLLNASDSLLAKGVIANNDGKFTIEGVASGKYFVVSTMVGFKKTTIPVFEISGRESIDLGTLTLEEETSQLNEVVIVADKPVFEQRIDRLVVNVENSITSAGSTVLEILERSPGISINRQSGSLAMSGKQGVQVMLNGKIQRLPASVLIQLLGGMTANNIEKIELITNPSAKYDAQGDAGIINIITKKNTGYGTNGVLSATVGYGYYGKSSGSFDVNHRTKNLNLFGNYSFTANKLWQKMEFNRSISNPDQQTETVSDRVAYTPIHQFRVGAEWTLNKKTSINTLVSGFDNQWKMDAINNSHVVQSGVDSVDIRLQDNEVNHWKNIMGNINISHAFKENQTLTFDADYLYYHDDNPHSFVNDYTYLEDDTQARQEIRISKKTPIRMGVFQMDYEQLMGTVKFEAGAKTTFSRLSNDVVVENYDQDEWVTDPKFTQDYNMKDDVLAAYMNASGKLSERVKYQLGLRTEHTDMEIVDGTGTNIFDLNFWSLFPSAFYSFQINKNNALQFSYGRRITRPSYRDIAPFVIFMDPFTFFSGNPKLKPTITDGVQASYTVKELLISLKYSHDKNFIANFQSKVDPVDKKTYFYSENLDNVKSTSLAFTFPITVTSWWKIQNNFTGLYQNIRTVYQDVPVSIQQFSGQFNSVMGFTLPKNYSFELSALYWTPSRFGIALLKSYANISAGVQKKFKNNNGAVSININDIFWTNYFRAETVNPELNQNQRTKLYFSEPRIVRITFTKNFGNNAVKSARKRSTASEAEQGRVR